MQRKRKQGCRTYRITVELITDVSKTKQANKKNQLMSDAGGQLSERGGEGEREGGRERLCHLVTVLTPPIYTSRFCVCGDNRQCYCSDPTNQVRVQPQIDVV